MRKSLPIVLLFFCALALACREDRPPLSPKQLGAVLLDLHLAEAYSQQIPRTGDAISMRNEDSLLVFQARILNRHQVSETRFRQATKWYTAHPELLDSVYQNILSEITILAAKQNK